MKDSLQWAEKLVGKIVLHATTYTIGKVTMVHEDEIESLELEPGHKFVAKEENFIALAEREANFYVGVQSSLSHYLREVLILGASMNVPQATAMMMVSIALQSQAAIVRAASGITVPHAPDDHAEPPIGT